MIDFKKNIYRIDVDKQELYNQSSFFIYLHYSVLISSIKKTQSHLNFEQCKIIQVLIITVKAVTPDLIITPDLRQSGNI